MTGSVLVEERARTARAAAPVAWLLVASLVCHVIQVSLTGYGRPEVGPFWLALDAILIALVYVRRSRAARMILVVTAMVGALLHGLGGIGADDYPLLLVLAWAGQAVPLLLRPVREHVHAA